MEKSIISKVKSKIHFLKENKIIQFCQCGNWPLAIVIGNTWFHLSHLEKLTALFCHIFSSRAIFPCVLSICNKHKGNFTKSSLRWGKKRSHMLGFTSSHKFLAFARIGIWWLYIHVLVVAVAKTYETPAWVSVVCHTLNVKTPNGNGSMLTASWLPSRTIVGNTCTVTLTGLHPFKSSARATVPVLAIRNVCTVQLMNLESFGIQ